MERRQKITLMVVVSLGVLVMISSIVRLTRPIKVEESSDFTCTTQHLLINSPTQLTSEQRDASDLTTWSSIEINTGLFCTSAPTLRPLLRNIAPNLLSSISQTFTGRSTVGQSTATSGYNFKVPLPVLPAKKA